MEATSHTRLCCARSVRQIERTAALTRQEKLLVDLAKLPLQVGDQFLDALCRIRVRRDLPGDPTVPQDLHFQFYPLALGHSIPNDFSIRRGGLPFCSLRSILNL